MTSDPSMGPLFTGELISLWEDLPASQLLAPGNGKVISTIDGSGTISFASFDKYGRVSSSLRTLLGSLLSSLWASTGYSLLWRKRAISPTRWLSVLGRSARHTAGNGSGSWGTPDTKMDRPYTYSSGDHEKPFLTLLGQARSWPMPDANASERGGTADISGQKRKGRTVTINDMVKAWPTPRESEWKGTGPKGSPSQKYRLEKGYLDATVEEIDGGLPAQENASTSGRSRGSWPTPNCPAPHDSDFTAGISGKRQWDLPKAAEASKTRGQLNSRWVAQLMGFPPDWCELPDETIAKLSKPMATQSSPMSRRRS